MNEPRRLPEFIRNKIVQVLEANEISMGQVRHGSFKEIALDGVDGLLAIIRLDSGRTFGVINAPVLVMPTYGLTFTLGDLVELVSAISGIPNASYSMDEKALHLKVCMEMPPLEEGEQSTALEELFEGVAMVNENLLSAIRTLYKDEIQITGKQEPTKFVLPNIKMTPKDMRVIYVVLMNCDPNTREIYTFLMQQWVKAGYFVETTEQAIVLDVPYGPRRARLAMLLPGVSPRSAAMAPNGQSRFPTVVLFWNSLQKQTGFPDSAVALYQQTIRKTNQLYLTESSAHLSMIPEFTLEKAKALLKAMFALAKTVIPEQVEAAGTSKPVTPGNLQATLEQCPPSVQNVFTSLIEGWKSAGGTIQSPKIGKIYLKMVTASHKQGKLANTPHKFVLLALSAPSGKKQANIQVAWNLASSDYAGYLDCIPEAVSDFEKQVSSLPGFEIKGTITYLWVSDAVNESHAQCLLEAVLQLKKSEALTQ